MTPTTLAEVVGAKGRGGILGTAPVGMEPHEFAQGAGGTVGLHLVVAADEGLHGEGAALTASERSDVFPEVVLDGVADLEDAGPGHVGARRSRPGGAAYPLVVTCADGADLGRVAQGQADVDDEATDEGHRVLVVIGDFVGGKGRGADVVVGALVT